MDKKLAGLLGVASVLAIPAQASTAVSHSLETVMQANSYSDLLKPIPNAVEILAAASQVPPENLSEASSAIHEAQYWYHHHHHHHHWRRRWHHHHHHHHHHKSI